MLNTEKGKQNISKKEIVAYFKKKIWYLKARQTLMVILQGPLS
jgi:hypothetical protein